MWFLSIWNWSAGGILKNLEMCARKSLVNCRQIQMGDSGGKSEDQNAIRNLDKKDCVHKDSGGNEDSVANWTRGHSRYILAKNLSTFCLCPETLVRLNLKVMV
jgi:hypothetical protein